MLHSPAGKPAHTAERADIESPAESAGAVSVRVRLQFVPVFAAVCCLQLATPTGARDEPSPRSLAPARVLSGEPAAARRPAGAAAAAIGRAVELAFLRWEKRRLAPTERFWRDFGMHIVSASSERIVARGTGPAPCIAIAEQGPRDRLVGVAFRMSEDRTRAVHDGVRRDVARPGAPPGGGHGIELLDPSGPSVWRRQGQHRVECLPLRERSWRRRTRSHHLPRVNRKVRTRSSRPGREAGHLVLQTVDFQRIADWSLRVLGLIPTHVHSSRTGARTSSSAV